MLDKAECVVETIIQGDAPTARASLQQVKSAAAALSLTCVANDRSQGGIVTNIGQSNPRLRPGGNAILAICPRLIKAKGSFRRRQQPRCGYP